MLIEGYVLNAMNTNYGSTSTQNARIAKNAERSIKHEIQYE